MHINKLIEPHDTEKEKSSAEYMLSDIKSKRRFKRSAMKGKCQDISNLLLVPRREQREKYNGD